MQRFAQGDRVRIDIPDEEDPDHETYHGKHGRVVEVLGDDADTVTGDGRMGGSTVSISTRATRPTSAGAIFALRSKSSDPRVFGESMND